MAILNCACKCKKSVGVSTRGNEFRSRKIKEVCWDDGVCYQGFLAYKKTVSNTGQEQKG